MPDGGYGLGPWREGTRATAGFPAPDDAVSVGARFFDIAERHPDRLAISSPAGRWTYRELLTDVQRRAGGLRAALDGTQRPVAILCSHDGPLVVTILATIVAGHVAVLVDPAAPEPEQVHVLRESGASLIVHDDAHCERAEALAQQVQRTEPALASDLTGDLVRPAALDPTSTLLLAFTSGTSGRPKAGVVTHGVLLNLVRGATEALGIGPEDRMPMLFPTSLAVAAYPMFLPLLNGGTLSTLDVRSVGLAPIPDFLESERITLAYMAPTVIRFLVDVLQGRTFPDIRMIALGGELVDAEIIRLTAELLGPEHIAVGYGTTETGVVSLHVQDADAETEGVVPCGHPVPDVEIRILDDDGRPAEPGEAGEIAILSPYMFGGYLGHPELSERVLTTDAEGRKGWGLYTTGDFGRVGPGGSLAVLGRVDTKVKVRGRFVVLGDVEADLHELEDVADCAVVSEIRDGNAELVAHVVTAPGSTVDGPALRRQLLARREAYRVPSRFVLLEDLPRLPNGKIDRRALKAPVRRPSPAVAATPEPDAQLVRTIRDVWEGLLPVHAVDIDADFAELGGDSLLAAQMLVALEHAVGVTVPMAELVHARTVRSLAEAVARIAADDRGAAPSTTALVQQGSADRPQLWFVHDLQGSAYRVRHVARELGRDQTVWSFESPLLRGEPNRFRSLDAFAGRYLRDLREVQPEGPYWLAGYSFGGICAYELARQLERDGQEVAFLGVIDVGPTYRGPGGDDLRSPFRPWFGVAKPPEPDQPLRTRIEHYRDMVRTSPTRAARHLMVRSGAARWIDPLRFRADLRRRGRVRPEWRLWYAWEQHWRIAARGWDRTRPFGGAMDLFWAEETGAADATMGWGPLVRDLKIHRFGGDHEGILEPRGAAALASVLRPAIDHRLTASTSFAEAAGSSSAPARAAEPGG